MCLSEGPKEGKLVLHTLDMELLFTINFIEYPTISWLLDIVDPLKLLQQFYFP